MPSVQVSKMTVADPGVGFKLDFSNCSINAGPPATGNIQRDLPLIIAFDALLVGSSDTDLHNCTLTLPAPIPDSIKDELMVFVLPFLLDSSLTNNIKLHLVVKQNFNGTHQNIFAFDTRGGSLPANADKVFDFSLLDRNPVVKFFNKLQWLFQF